MQFRRNSKTISLERNYETTSRKKNAHFGSFYLRTGAITFGIGNMVYSGLEMGQYFELIDESDESKCRNIFMLLSPLFRMCLTLMQMQFICELKI